MVNKTENSTKGQQVKAYCNKCKRSTNHLVRVSWDLHGTHYDHNDGEEFPIGEWNENYQVLECGGCESYVFKHRLYDTEGHSGDDAPLISENFYPERHIDLYPSKAESYFELDVPDSILSIYKEIVVALNSRAYALCAVGIRSLVENICIAQGVKNGPVTDKNGVTTVKNNIEGKINGLMQKNVLSNVSSEILHIHRLIGNKAAHNFLKPPISELKLALEIIEEIISILYTDSSKNIEIKGKELKTRYEKRNKAKS